MAENSEDVALDTIKFAIRSAIAQTANVTGLKSGDAVEHLVKFIIDELFDSPMRWAIKKHLDDLQYNELISFAHNVATEKKPPGEGGVPA